MIRIIGIDCSTSDSSVAVAVGSATARGARINSVEVCRAKAGSAAETIKKLLQRQVPTLLALDAPLGWPDALGHALASHRAGQLIAADSNDLFRRHTDREIKRITCQQPLDVGANLIARTAHWALRLLHDLGEGSRIPLAWHPRDVVSRSAIEVYPAATMRARGIEAKSYKKRDQKEERRRLLRKLAQHVQFAEKDLAICVGCADAIDAAVCVLAGADFLKGRCFEPTKPRLARKEGWIWAMKPIDAKECG